MLIYHINVTGDKIIKPIADTVVVAGIPLAVLEWPYWSVTYSFLGIVWLLIRIYETALIQRIKFKIKKWLYGSSSA